MILWVTYFTWPTTRRIFNSSYGSKAIQNASIWHQKSSKPFRLFGTKTQYLQSSRKTPRIWIEKHHSQLDTNLILTPTLFFKTRPPRVSRLFLARISATPWHRQSMQTLRWVSSGSHVSSPTKYKNEQFLIVLVTIQPFRSEINRVISHYLAPGAPRELNISHKNRTACVRCLTICLDFTDTL